MRDYGVRKALLWSVAYVALALVLGAAIGGCMRGKRGTQPLQGELEGADGVKMSLYVPFRRELGAVDSAVLKDGRFKFTNGELRGVYVFGIPKVGEWLVYLSETPTRMVFEEKDPLLAQPYGDTLNWLLRENHLLVRDVGAKMQELSQEYAASTVDGDKIPKAKLDALDVLWDRASSEFEGKITALISDNVENPVGIFLLRQYKEMFTPEGLEELRGKVEAYAAAHAEDANAAAMQTYLQRNTNLLVGAYAPPVNGVLVESGKEVSLDSLLKGERKVLVQFWSLGDEGSDSCVLALNGLVEKHGRGAFGVVGMCFAPTREEALEYLAAHGVEWPNILVYSEISEQYNVWGGAKNFLYGADSRLLARDVTLNELEERLGKAQ